MAGAAPAGLTSSLLLRAIGHLFPVPEQLCRCGMWPFQAGWCSWRQNERQMHNQVEAQRMSAARDSGQLQWLGTTAAVVIQMSGNPILCTVVLAPVDLHQ